jgi:PAS domain S-box-containing protein
MKIPRITRLSTKLLSIYLVILGTTMIILFSIFAVVEYFVERRILITEVQKLIDVQKAPITTALWEYDIRKLNLFLTEVGTLPFVQGAIVSEKSGKVVVKHGDIGTPPNNSEFSKNVPLVFSWAGGSETIGTFELIVHDGDIIGHVLKRAETNAIIFLVFMVILSATSFIATNLIVGRPLHLLQLSINSIRKDGVRQLVNWNSEDELGRVVHDYNDLQKKQERTKASLQLERDNLEIHVKDRTKSLASALDRAKAAEKEIYESEQRLQSIFEASPIGWACVQKEGAILDVNEQFCKFFKMPRAKILKTVATELYNDPADRISIINVVLKDHILPPREVAYKLADGSNIWAMLSMKTVQYRGEAAIFCWIYDISERKRAEEERLLQTQKMESLGQLTSSVAHDFNNLLTVMRCNIEILRSQKIDEEQRQLLIKDCYEAVELSTNLTKRLTGFARMAPFKNKSTNLCELIYNFKDLLNRSAGKNIIIEYTLTDRNIQAQVDSTLFEVGLLNLVTNARDAILASGRIIVQLTKVDIKETVESIYGKVERRQYGLLQVSDTGIGMTPEVMEKAFEAFFTTKDEYVGTGLGLNTVKDLVRSSNGFIQLRSEPAKGTTVSVFLPICDV